MADLADGRSLAFLRRDLPLGGGCSTLPLSMSEPENPQRQTPDSLMLRGFWYRALPSRQVRGNRLHKLTLLEIPLVVGCGNPAGASAGRPFALRDACPHRGMPLACGRFDGQQL